jgi:WD40 repeat protein
MQATPDRSLLITADAGPKASLLVFWDPATGQPISTVQHPHADGVISMAVSADGQQLATIGAPTQDSDGSQQEVRARLMYHSDRLCPWCNTI